MIPSCPQCHGDTDDRGGRCLDAECGWIATMPTPEEIADAREAEEDERYARLVRMGFAPCP